MEKRVPNMMSPGSRTDGYLYAQYSKERLSDDEILAYARACSGKYGDEAAKYAWEFLFGYQIARLPQLPVKITPLQKKIMDQVAYDSSMGDWSTLETLTGHMPSHYTKEDIQAVINKCPLISSTDEEVISCPDQADRVWLIENGLIVYL